MDVRGFRLTDVPPDFFEDPYRYYAALREQARVHRLEDSAVFLTRYEDVVALYRDARASSDKKVEFKPKFGDSPLNQRAIYRLRRSGGTHRAGAIMGG